MEPGKFNRRVQLQKRTMVDGDEIFYGKDVKNVWANVEQISSREAIYAGAISMPDTIRVKIWYRSLNAEEYRLSYAGNIYNIGGAIDIGGRHEELELTCTKEPDPSEVVE